MEFNDFLQHFKINLNEQQQAAVKRIDGATLLLAVPGSGKTTVIVSRIGYMISCLGVPCDNILTVTFSVAAAQDMKQRFATKFPELYTEDMQFRTIHGFCSLVIRKYEQMYNRTAFELISQEGREGKILRGIFKDVMGKFPTENNINDLMQKITYCKNMMLSDEEIKEMHIPDFDLYRIFCAYREYKTSHKLMDYDDQLEFAYKILRKYPEILSYYQRKYKYINVDEAQDTSKIQHMIIRLLVGDNTVLFMVGDEDQSIYAFRAAYPTALLEFEKVYENAKVLLMEKNYRSTKEIVSHAKDFIKLNKERYDKNMVTDNEDGEKIRYRIFEDYSEQYSYLLERAMKASEQTAVLYRNNESAIPIIDLFERNNVEFRLKENSALFFTHFIVTDIIKIIKFAFNPKDADLFMDIYYKMGFSINKKTALQAVHNFNFYKNKTQYKTKTIMDFVLNEKEDDDWGYRRIVSLRLSLELIKKDNTLQAIERVLSDIDYNSYLNSWQCDKSKINTLKALAFQNPDINVFLERLDYLEKYIKEGSPHKRANFILSTIHSSKGLEYDNVILIDIKDDIMPGFTYEDESVLTDDEKNTLEEERRLFFVAVTRAKTGLEIISAKKNYGVCEDVPKFISQFLHIEPSKKKKITEQEFIKVWKAFEQDVESGKLFVPGKNVTHKLFGNGVVTARDENSITIHFSKSKAEKKLDLKTCIVNKLLTFYESDF